MTGEKISARLALTAVLLYFAPIAATAGTDCASYTREALKIVTEVQNTFMQALDKDVSTDDLRCEFAGSQWSKREQRHRDWCGALPAAQVANATDKRLQQMRAEATACKGDVTPRLAAAKPAGPQNTPASPARSGPGGSTPTSAPAVQALRKPAPRAETAARTAPINRAAISTTDECPRLLDALWDSRIERCTCSSKSLRGAPKPGEKPTDFDNVVVCHEAVRVGLMDPKGGVLNVSDLIAREGDTGAQIFEPHPDARAAHPGKVFTLQDAPPGSSAGPEFLPPNPDEGIRVGSASYGANCPGARPVDDAAQLAQACNGTIQSCQYHVDLKRWPDPAPGCAKTYIARWSCGKDSRPKEAQARRRLNLSALPTDLYVTLQCD